MATIYVATTGNDSSGNGSEGSPYLTISKAWAISSSADTIIVNDSGTYTVVEGGANQITTASGQLKTGLTIKAADGHSPIFDGGGSATYCMKCWNSWVIQGLTFRNFDDGTSTGRLGGVIQQYFSNNDGTVLDCVFYNCTGPAVTFGKAGSNVSRNTIYNMHAHTAIDLKLGVSHANNNLIYNCSGQAIKANQGSADHNTVHQAPRHASFNTTSSYRNYSIFAKHAKFNIVTDANVNIAGLYAVTTSTYNCVSGSADLDGADNSPTNYAGNAPGTGDIQSDPVYVNKDFSSSPDYRLQLDSPCLAGAVGSTQDDSIEGTDTRDWQYIQRIFGITPASDGGTENDLDMGCYEVGNKILGTKTKNVNKVMGAAG